MNKILDFLRIPLVKIIGICAILYLALFSEKQNPNSLGNRLSKEKVTKNLSDAKERSRFIISNVRTTKEAAIKQDKIYQPDAGAKISIEDIDVGKGDIAVSCGSTVEFSYGIYSSDNKQIKVVSSEKLVVGGGTNKIIENNIFGMRQGGIRNIKIPHNFKTDNRDMTDLLKFYNADIRYQLFLVSVAEPNITSHITCK